MHVYVNLHVNLHAIICIFCVSRVHEEENRIPRSVPYSCVRERGKGRRGGGEAGMADASGEEMRG